MTSPYFRRYDGELVSTPAISLKKVGGAIIVERLPPPTYGSSRYDQGGKIRRSGLGKTFTISLV